MLTCIPAGTRVYHKTHFDYDPCENTSVMYTLAPPVYNVTDRGQSVHVYEVVRDCRVLFDMSFIGEPCLKIMLYAQMIGADSVQLFDVDVKAVLQAVLDDGLDGLVSRMDDSTSKVELICSPQCSAQSALRWVSTYQLSP